MRIGSSWFDDTTGGGHAGTHGERPVDDDFAAVRRAATLAGLHQTQ
jgi:hypothetical protein